MNMWDVSAYTTCFDVSLSSCFIASSFRAARDSKVESRFPSRRTSCKTSAAIKGSGWWNTRVLYAKSRTWARCAEPARPGEMQKMRCLWDQSVGSSFRLLEWDEEDRIEDWLVDCLANKRKVYSSTSMIIHAVNADVNTFGFRLCFKTPVTVTRPHWRNAGKYGRVVMRVDGITHHDVWCIRTWRACSRDQVGSIREWCGRQVWMKMISVFETLRT